ncbi:MAG: hypothetical protein QCH31_07670 [Methanolobus sp.]|nr:hypothetical protein [Methanolobus sp.]
MNKQDTSYKKHSFYRDEKAYIPFAVIGVFILMFSVFASVYLTKMDYELAEVIYNTDTNDVERTAVNMASADLSRCLNYAGMQAMAWQGEHPVIVPEEHSGQIVNLDGFSVAASDRNVEPGKTLKVSVILPADISKAISCVFSEKPRTLVVRSDSGVVYQTMTYDELHSFWSRCAFEEEITIPQNAEYGYTYLILEYDNETKAVDWVHVGSSPLKDITAQYFNDYLRTNYQANQHTFNKYAINVEPAVDPSQIRIDKINGTLVRELARSTPAPEYPIYYTMTVKNLNYTLVDLTTGSSKSASMDVTALITSRQPLLEQLVNEYEKELSAGVTSDIVLGATNIRTFTYGPWQHYLSGPLNIVTGPALTASVNAGSLYAQKRVFDSVDPWALTYTSYYNSKVLYNDISRDTSTYEEEKKRNLSSTYDRLAGEGTFNISVHEGIGESMKDANTSIEEVAESSKIVISVSNFTNEVYSNWVYNDNVWSKNEPDLLHDVTREVYSATIQGQVLRDGFREAVPYGLITGPASCGPISYERASSKNKKNIEWTSYHPVSFSHTCALGEDHEFNGILEVDHIAGVDASSKRWYFTGVDVDHISTDITIESVDVSYDYLGNDRIRDLQRVDDYLLREDRSFDWKVTYNVRFKVKTRWDISYNYHWSFKTYTASAEGAGHWNFFSGDSSGSLRGYPLVDSGTIIHSRNETEDMSIVYHQYLPSGGYSGLDDTYDPGSSNDYRSSTVIVNGSPEHDPGCSDAADKYRAEQVSDRLLIIEKEYYSYNNGTLLPPTRVHCDIPEWLLPEMAGEMEEMFTAINADNPTREVSLLGENLGRDPTRMIQEASLDLAGEMADRTKRESFIKQARYMNGPEFNTSSDAARAIAKNEAYQRLLKELRERNQDIGDSFTDHIDESFTREQGHSILGLVKNKVSTDVLFNNPAMDMASTALAAQMGIIETMEVVGLPGSKYSWTENMTIVVDQYPDYLYHDPDFDMQGQYRWEDEFSGLTIYPLGVRNVCVFSTGIGDSIAEMLSEASAPLKDAISQSMSQSISDMNGEIDSLLKDLDSRSAELAMGGISVDTAVIEQNRAIMTHEYSTSIRQQVPVMLANEVAKDPVLSMWISNSDVRLITSAYLNDLSDDELISKVGEGTLQDELMILISEKIKNENPTISSNEMDVALYRLKADLGIGIADGVSEAVNICQETIDQCFENINSELQKMLDDSTDKLTGNLADQMEKRLQRSMKLVPAGLPVIPPHWVCTVNVWEYDVKGMYKTFKVIDNDNECLFNPYFGHDAQVYIRKDGYVFHPTKTDIGGSLIVVGRNQPIKFGFSGYAATVVGPGPKGVGDKVGERDERSIAYDNFELQI